MAYSSALLPFAQPASCLCRMGRSSPALTARTSLPKSVAILLAMCSLTFRPCSNISAGAQANGSFIGNTLAEGGDSTGQNMFAPGFRTPRSFQFNVGVQRELGRGTVVSADYVRNVSTHY